ncbi:MAG: ATP-binding protein [Anaerolineae bacterium]|nr:ATP-binding protein [Anaerolineae bacterium]
MPAIIKNFINSFRKRTITGDLTNGLTISACVVMFFFGLFNYSVSVQQIYQNLHNHANDTVQKMSEILSVPLWKLDNDTIQKIGQSFLQSEDVAGLRISDENNRLIFNSSSTEDDLIHTVAPIYYQGYIIGQVDVYISTSPILDLRLNIIRSTLLATIFVILTLRLVTHFMLQRFLITPMQDLIHGMDTIASGSDYHGLKSVPQQDMNQIVQRVNLLSYQIGERVEDLRRSEERFRQVITSISDIIYQIEITKGSKPLIHYKSPHVELLTGYPLAQSMDDWSFWRNIILHPDDREIGDKQWQNLFNGISSEAEYRIIHQNGKIIWVRDNARVELSGDHLMAYGIISDISEHKKVEESLRAETAERKLAEEELRKYQGHLEELVSARTLELQTLNKELESFAYSISHDLRAPLRHIDGFSHALLEDYGDQIPPEALDYLQRVRKGTQHMSDLIDGLLRLSRLTRQPLTLESVQPALIIQAALDDLSIEQEKRVIDIDLKDLPECQADPILLRQVYINLLSNAIKYTRPCNPARIEVGCMQQDGKCVYYVRDNGIGFDPVYADKLFGVFQRLHTESEFSGTGVGLAIVQRIIHRHGGKIWAESRLNQGAVFYFTLD